VNFEPLEGKEVKHTVNFTVKNQPIDKVRGFDFEKYGSFITNKNNALPDIPYIRFTSEDITEGTHMVNGLVMTRGFREILVGPSVNNIELTIKIPSRNFIEKVNAQSYRLNDTKFVIQFDCHIYTVKMVLALSTDNNSFYLTFTFNEKNTYTDNSLAIKWIDFLCAFFNKEDFYIKEISSNVFNINSQHPETIKHNFNEYKKYYDLIKQIEMDGDIEFKTYNQCTEQNLEFARYISSFLSRTPLRRACNGGIEISTQELICDDEFVERAQNKLPVSIISTDTDKKVFKLNGRTFVVPYTHSVYSPCLVKKIKKGRKGYMAADLKYNRDNYLIYFSSQSASELFPGVKEFKSAKETV